MDEMAVGGAEALTESGEAGVFAEGIAGEAEMLFDEVLDKVVLLPLVRRFLEGGHRFQVLGDFDVEELVELLEDRAIVGGPFFPRAVLERKEVLVSEVLDESEVLGSVIIDDGGDVETDTLQEMGEGEEKRVVGALLGVVEADEGGMPFRFHPEDGAARGPRLDGLDDDFVGRVQVQVGSRGCEEGIGGHGELGK